MAAAGSVVARTLALLRDRARPTSGERHAAGLRSRATLSICWRAPTDSFVERYAGRVIAFYPSPAGATESLLPLDAWNSLSPEVA